MVEVWPRDKFVIARLDRKGGGESRVFELKRFIPRPRHVEAYLQETSKTARSIERWYLDLRFFKPKKPECLQLDERVYFGSRTIKSRDDDVQNMGKGFRVYPVYRLGVGGSFCLTVENNRRVHTIVEIFSNGIEAVQTSPQPSTNSWPLEVPRTWIEREVGAPSGRLIDIPGIIGVGLGGRLTDLVSRYDLKAGFVSI